MVHIEFFSLFPRIHDADCRKGFLLEVCIDWYVENGVYIYRPTWLYIPPVTLLGVFSFGPNGDVVSCRVVVIKTVLRLRSAGPFYVLSSGLGCRRRSGGYIWSCGGGLKWDFFAWHLVNLGLGWLLDTWLFLALFRDMIPPSLFFLIFVTILQINKKKIVQKKKSITK